MIPDFMIFKPQTWLKWAGYFMPDKRKDWLAAMEAELTEMPDRKSRQSFALGCFRVALLEGARSRKGLNYIARGGGAILIVMACAIGIKFNLQPSEGAERVAVSKLLLGLCALYMGSAWLLIVSLRHLRIYAGIGLIAALTGWVYCSVAQPKLGALPLEFMTALSVEATGFMATLLLATIYLNWLYTPEWDEDV